MNREEALIEFNEKYATKYLSEALVEFNKLFMENEENIEKLFIESLKKLINKCNNEKDENYKLTIFQFEILRINILNESFEIYLHGYNEEWYLDENPLLEKIDLKFLFNPYIKLKEKLIKNKKIYFGKVNNYDIQKIIFDGAIKAYKELGHALRRWFYDIDDDEFVKSNLKSDIYVIKTGEYEGENEIVFAMDNNKRSNKHIEAYLKATNREVPLIYSVWKNSELINLDLKNNPMLFINFKESILNNINFTNCDIIKGNFKKAKIINCTFDESRVVESEFNKCIINDTSFNEAFATNMDFTGSILKNVQFKNTDLRESFFIDVEFENVDFENANLERCIFNARDIPYIHLSSEQLQTILIKGDDDKK